MIEAEPNKKILIADDTRENLQSAMRFLLEDSIPYALLAAQNGKMAIEIAKKELPDIIIMDWEMPVMNGIEATIELKKDPITQYIPIIISTGIRLTSSDFKAAFDAGASDFLRKPLENTEFKVRINFHLKLIDLINDLNEQFLINTKNENKQLADAIKQLLAANEESIEIINHFNSFLSNISTKISILENNSPDVEKIVSSIAMFRNKLLLNTDAKKFDKRYIYTLLQKHPNLTSQEIQLCVLIKRNLQIKEISEITFCEISSVKVARSRLRKKLGLEEKDNLYSYLNLI